MNFLQITYCTVLRNIRNWKLLLLLIVAPLLLYLINGAQTANMHQHLNSEKVKAAYFNADGGPMSQQLIQFLETKENQTSFRIQKVDSLDDGYRMVKDGEIEAFIYIKNGFSASLNQGKNINIEISSNKRITATRLLVESFINIGYPNLTQVSSGVKNIPVSPSAKVLTDADKYPYLASLELLFFGALLGSFSVLNFKKNTRIRLNVAPINRFTHVVGSFLGNFLTLFISTALFMAYTYYVFGSFSQGNRLNIFLIFLLFTIIITALGMIAGYLTKKAISSLLIIVSLNIFLAGAVMEWAFGTANGLLKWILYVSPHYYIYSIVTDTALGGFTSRIQASLMAMVIEATVLFGFTLYLGRRKAI